MDIKERKKIMKKITKIFIVAIGFVLLMSARKASAQITDEKNIPKGYKAIYTIADLYSINNDMEGNYILMADIDMSETAPGGDWDFGYGWRPIGYDREASGRYREYGHTIESRFYGTLDGNGHKISNLNFCNDAPYAYLGLFAANQGEIKNLGLENVNINLNGYTQFDYCGCIASYNVGEIYNCYVTGNISIEKRVSEYDWEEDDDYCYDGYVGGITNDYSGGFHDCYTNILIHANRAGGIAGRITEGWEEYNCYTIGKVEGIESDLIASDQYRSIKKSYYLKTNGEAKNSTALSNAQMKLKDCFTGFDFKEVWFIDPNSSYPYPQLVDCPQVRIESIKITSLPKKLEYSLKDKLDLAGAELTINYEDNYSVKVPIVIDMCSYSMNKGTQKVTVNYLGKTDTFEIEVGKEAPELTIMAQASELEVGETFTFDADYTGTEKITYSSSNSKVLSINSKNGDATAIKAGKTVVTIQAGSLKKEIEVSVVKASGKDGDSGKTDDKKQETITEDSVEPDFEMEVGETFKLAVKKVSSMKLTSSDKNVVTISKKGKVKAIAPGTATITIKNKSTKKVVAKYIIVVLSEEEPDFEIEAGETMRIALKSGYTLKSSNENIVSIGSKGKITGVKPGIATITVYDKNDKEYEKYLVSVVK